MVGSLTGICHTTGHEKHQTSNHIEIHCSAPALQPWICGVIPILRSEPRRLGRHFNLMRSLLLTLASLFQARRGASSNSPQTTRQLTRVLGWSFHPAGNLLKPGFLLGGRCFLLRCGNRHDSRGDSGVGAACVKTSSQLGKLSVQNTRTPPGERAAKREDACAPA